MLTLYNQTGSKAAPPSGCCVEVHKGVGAWNLIVLCRKVSCDPVVLIVHDRPDSIPCACLGFQSAINLTAASNSVKPCDHCPCLWHAASCLLTRGTIQAMMTLRKFQRGAVKWLMTVTARRLLAIFNIRIPRSVMCLSVGRITEKQNTNLLCCMRTNGRLASATHVFSKISLHSDVFNYLSWLPAWIADVLRHQRSCCHGIGIVKAQQEPVFDLADSVDNCLPTAGFLFRRLAACSTGCPTLNPLVLSSVNATCPRSGRGDCHQKTACRVPCNERLCLLAELSLAVFG